MRVGIDIGGTKIEGVILDADGSTIIRERVPTQSQKGYPFIISQIAKLWGKLNHSMEGEFTVGVCVPGPLDHTGRRIKKSNAGCLVNQPIRDDIEAIVGVPITMDNDANCFAQAETSLGAAKGENMVFGVIMGTGVGGGICIHGKVHKGHQYLAGEWGHSLLHPGGNACYCGKSGCVESYISGPSLERRFTEFTGEVKPLKEIIKNPPQDWKEEFLTNFGMALSNIVNILDPDIIVLGGGVSNIDFLYTEGHQYVERYCFNDTLDTPIVKNKLGDSAGVFGAAYLP